MFLEPLETRLVLSHNPVLLIPGFGGTMPADDTPTADWLTQRGIAPDHLQVDPLAHVYDNLVQTLENVGYIQGEDLFVANWDWRVPVAPQDGIADGSLQNVTAASITDAIYETGLDYLGYWLKKAADWWGETYDEPLTTVDVIAHSTGGLVARSYLQSAAYGEQCADFNKDSTLDPLPAIRNLVLVGVPNQGSGDIWNILQNDFNASLSTRGLGLVVHSAWDLAEQGTKIRNPDGSEMSFTDPKDFIDRYVASGHDLLPTFDFLDSDLNGGYEALSGEYANTLLRDMNSVDPAAAGGFVDQLTGDLTVVHGTGVETVVGADQHTGPSILPTVQNFDELLGHIPATTETWYVQAKDAAGDGTVPTSSALWSLVEGDHIHLEEQVGVGHTLLVSDLNAQKSILGAIGRTNYTDDQIVVDPTGGDSGLMQLATKLFNGQEAEALLGDGIQGFFDNLQNGVNSIFQTLPIIGPAFVDTAGTFFSDFGDSLADLAALGPTGIVFAAQQRVFDVLGPVLQDINGDNQVNSDDVAIGLVDGALEFKIQLGGQIAGTSVDIGFDVGLDALGLELEVNGGLDLSVDWKLSLGFGLDFDGLDPFFYLVCDQGNEAELSAQVALQDGTSLFGKLAFLQLTATDFADEDDIDNSLDPNDIPNPHGNTGLYGSIGIDLREPGYYLGGADGRLTIDEMSAMTGAENGLRQMIAGVVNAGADVNLHLVTGFGGSAVFPSISADLDIDWDFLSVDTGNTDDAILSSQSPIIAFNDIALDLGSFIGDFVGPVLNTVTDVLEPIMPLIDALTAPVPVISELAEEFSGLALDYIDPLADRNEGISIYDMAKAIQNIKPDPRLGLVLAVIDVVDIIYDVSSVAADGVIELGSFVIGGSSDGADVRTAPDLSTFGRNEQPQDTMAQLDQPGGKSAKSFVKKALSTANQVIKFPILTDPMQAFNLLMGRDADLIKLDIPELDFEFAFGQGITIFPGILTVDLGGTFSAYANVDFGFDTYGIRKYKESGDFADVFDGFYVDDHVVNGVDQPEVTFTAGLNAGAFAGAVLVAAEVSGGITGTVSADLCDIDPDGSFTQFVPDGRIRPSEIAQLIAYDPFAFFELSGSIDYYFNAWAGVGIIVNLGFAEIRETVWEDTWNLASGTLVEFKLATPYPAQDPVLAHLGGTDGRELILHTGPNASLRKYGNVQDGAENFTVFHSNDHIIVSGMGGAQQFLASDIDKIVAYGGQGNDTFLVTADVPADIKVLIRGGEGDDVIKAYGGSTYLDPYPNGQSYGLYGESGNDQLHGGNYDDTLSGGEGDDKLLGGDGDDRLIGDAGSDYLRGDAGNDLLFGDTGDIRLLGGSGDDWLKVTAGVAGTAVPTIDGGSGDDTIIAEYANLDIIGGYGNNSLTITRDDAMAPAAFALARSPSGGDSGSVVGPSAVTFRGINESINVQLGGLEDIVRIRSTLDCPLTVVGGGGGDQIYLESVQAPTTVDLAAAGDDTVTLGRSGSLQLLEHTVTVQGGSEGTDRLIFDNSADPSNHLGDEAISVGATAVSGLPLLAGVNVTYDAAVDAVEVRLGGGRDDVVVPDLARHVVIRGGGGADTGVATLVDAVGRLDTVDVETVWLRDERATSEVWNLNDIGLSAGGATVLTTTGAAGAVASHILLGDLDDSITVTAVGHETHIETGGGADTVEIAGDTAGLSAIGAALVLRAGDETAEDPGVDALAIDDTARTLATSGIISPGNITGFGLAMPLGYAGFEMLTFDGSAASYDLTVADTSAPTTIALGTGADTVTVLDTAHPATISTGGGNNSATIRAAGAALTLDGGTDHDVLTYAPPAGAAGNLALTGTGENQGSLSPNVTFTGIEEIDFELPESNDSLALDYTFTGTRLEIRGNGGNDTVTAVRIGGTTTFAGGAGFDRLSVQGTGDPTTHFTSLTIEPGLELLALDGRGNTATVDWHAASGGIYLGGVQEGNLLINSDAARETRILGREGDTLTVQELANRAVDATIDGNRVELVTGAQVLSPGTFISDDPGDDTDFTYSLGTLEGVADVATFDQFVYTASAGDNTVGVFEDVGGGQLELRQIVKDGLEGVDSLQGVSRVVISEDGKFVYVSAAPDNALTVFSRNAQSGLLNLIQVVRDGEGGVDGLQGVADLALRGNNLYAASPGDNALAVFAMGQDAQLIFTEAIPNTPSTNVALEKAALQSSTYNNLTYCGADRAVDGNRDPVWHSDSTNSIAHTKLEAGALWEVDLGGDYHLDRVQLFDRYGYPEQLSNFVVMVYNDDVDGEGTDVLVWQSPTISALPAGGLRLDLPGGTVGDRVRIQNQGTTSRPLVIAECEVYSRGVPGLTGINSVTVSEDGTRVYTTADSGSISAFARDPWGNLALLDLARPLFPTDVESNLANRTPFYGPPDNHNYDLRDDYWVVFDLGDYRVFDQPGGDFNVYEAASSDIEFGDEAVDVSEDGVTWFDVTNPRRAALTIPGDEAHGNPAYARSYDISMTGVDSVRYIRVRGIDDDYDSFWGTGNRGFDFDAVGAFVVPAAELSVPGASDVAEIVMGDRRVLHVLAEGGPTLSLFDVSFPGVAGGAIWASLDLTGALNADMIVNNGTGAIDAVQSGWGTEHYSFITQSAAAQLGGTAGNGLPDNGVIAGSPLGFPVQLAYRNNDDGYNAIRLDAGSPVYLTLEPGDQTRYGSLFLLGASCYGDAAIRVELRYADGSTETVSLNVDDWWQDDGELSPNVIPIVNGMDWHHSGSWYNINDAAVFAMPVPADGSKALVGMTFTQLSTSGPSTAILGVMGRVLARPLEGPDIGPVTAIEAMALPPLYLWERFSDGDTNNLAFPTNPYAGRWTVVDQGTITPPSHWFVSGGILRQDSNIYSASEYANRLGTYVYYDDGSGESYRWTNYELEADLHPTDNDGIGLIFRYTDDDNYYKLDMDSQRGFRKLFKMANGVETTLWSDAVSYTPGRWLNVKIRAVGNEIEVLIDDVQIAKVSDASPLTRGTVAVYCWGQQEAQFDNVRVRELRSGGQLPAIFALGEDAVGVYNVDRPSLSLQATDTEPFDGTNPVALHVTEDQISVVDAGIDPTSGLLHTFEIATAHRFNSAGNWPVGNGPASVAVADLNGDGYLDLVTANSNSNNVSVLRGSGNGAFQAATYTSVGTYPFALTVADLNGDGYLDLVTANSSSNNVSVLRGNGNGTFQAATHIGVGTCPYSVAVADLNGDGYPDLVTANHDSNNVSVLRGNGNGTFQAATHIAVGTSPYSVAVADLNGDGYLDLVAANSGSNNVSVLRGNGNGTFQAATHFGVATPYSVAVADLDGKGPPDLVTAGYGGVYVMLGTIGGGYESPVRLSAGTYPWDVAAVDMNGDGYQDLVVANYWSHNVSVLMGYGNGTFQLAMHFPTGLGPVSVDVGDLNGDSELDIASANWNGNNISALLGEGYFTFGSETTTTAAEAAMSQPLTLSGLQSVTVSPDGKSFVYAVNPESNALVALSVDDQGALSIVESYVDDQLSQSGAVDGLQGARQVVLNPLHDQLYVLSPGEPVLAVFDRNSSEGTLALRQKLAVAADANGLTVSPDGDAVYVSSPTGFGIWTRQTDGLLIERVGPHGDAGDWIIRAAGSSGTGTLLFLTSDSGDTVQVLVDSGTAISHLQDITGIVDPSAVALSPDGQHLFVTSAADHALHVLVKQADESYLPLQTFREGEAGLRGMKGPNGVAVSPAGDYVYVTAGQSDSLVVFRLNQDNGMFEFAQIIRNGASTTLGLKSPNSVAVDPQSGRVFVGSSAAASQNGGVATFNFGIYEAGADTLIYDGGDDYQIVGGESGTAGGLSYFDQDSSGDYTAGEDIWHDVGSQSGVYDTGDQLIYDGTDDGQNNDYQIVGGEPGTVTGLYYCDQDASGGYTAGEDIWKKGAGFAVSFSGMQQLHLSSAGGSDNIRLVAPPTNAGTTIPVTVETGEGDDSVLLSRFGSTTTVDTAGGADTVDIRVGEENTTLTVSAGDGNDRISLAGTAAGSTTTINADDGNDTVRVNGARLVSGVTVNGGAPDAPEEDVLLFDAGGGTTETSDGTIWVVGGGVVSYSNIDLTNIALPVPDAGTYDSIYEGGSVTLNGSSTVISGLTVDYAWDIDGDGIYGDRAGGTTTLEWGDLVGFGLGDDGVYQFSLRVTVTGGNEAQENLVGLYTDAFATVTILNTEPLLASTGDKTAEVGDEFTISFSLAEPDPGDDTIVEWSVDWGDGVVETLPSDAGSATHRYETTGNFVVTVTATDEDGSYTQEVDPVVSPPVPAISTVVSVADLTIREGDGVTLLATAPGSPSFAWDLDGIDQGGDGDRFDDAVGAEVKFEWEELIGLGIGDSGSYTVRVQATYTDYGANTTQSREGTATLTVENVAPTAVLTSSTRISGVPILEGGTATVRFQGQNDPSPADATAGFRYFYDFEDDGIFEIANSTEPTVDVPSEFLDDDGELLVRAVIADKDAVDAGGNIKQGAATSEYFTSVAVRNVVPTLTNLQATAAVENQSTTLTGEIVDAGTADAFTLTVKWGDGSEQSFYYPAGTSSFSETHLYLDDPAGSSSDKYTIQLTVDDGDDGIGLAQAVVSVDNVAPVLNNLTVTSTLNEGETATLSGVIADLGTNDSFTLTVDWGDGSLAETTAFEVGTTTFSLSHPYPDEGLYSVSVALQDDDAGLDQPATGLTVTVKNVPPSLTNVTLTPVINEGDAATLSGEITLGQLLNAGTQGSFRLMVDWGDGSAKQIFRYPAGTTSFSETHTYADNPTGTEDFPVTVTLFDDSLGFLPAQISTTTGSTGGDVEGDFNHDGHLDLAVASEAEGTVRLLLGDGMGGYSEQLRFTGKARPQAVLYADFNQDGIADRVRTNKYFELDLSGFNFAVADAAAIRQAVFDTLNCGVLSDTNGDGEITPDDVVIDMVDTEPDDVAETFVITARIVSQEGLKEKIWDALLMNPTCLPAGFTWSDMPDPTVADQLDVSLGTGDAGLYMAVMGSPTGGQASAIATADFNNDGKPDLALVTSAGGVVVQMGTGDGTFSAPTVLPIGTGVASDVIAEDLNEDGVADVAVAVPESHQVRVLYGAGDGSFAADDNGPVTMAGFAAAGLRAVDFNADGLVDLLAFSRSDGPVYAILGEMVGDEREFADPARIADPRTFPAGSDPRYLAVGDFDGDGRLDLAVASSSSETVLVLLGDGTGGLSTPYDFAVGAVPTGLSVADHNDDGRLDLIAATATTSNPDGARVLLREPVSQVTGNVSVANVAPTLTVSGAETVGAEATYTLSLSSSDPGDDVIMSWLINWGDESPEETIDGDVAAVTHTYTGGLESYTILAVASDEDGTYPQISKTISVAKVAADQPKVSVNEGSLATNTGTYRGLGDTVEITASLGTISHNGGTWNWSYNPADGPDASQPVTITATYGEGQVSTTFALAVVNVAPTATLSHNGPITYGQTVTVGFTEPFDPSDDDVAVGFHYAFATSPAVFSDVSYDSGSNANATFTFEELAAGDHTLYARIIDKDGGFNEYSIDMTVNKALLTVKADNQTKVYGAAEPELTYTPSGTLFYTDTYHVISGVVLATATGADATAGTHTIAASGGAAANYAVEFVEGTLTVSKAPALAVTADDQRKVYGEADPVLTYTPSGTLYYGETYDVISGVTLSAPTGAAATAGTHTIAASGGSAANYAVEFVEGTLTVSKAPALAVTADDQRKVYGAADPVLTYTPSGDLFYTDTYDVISGVVLATTIGAAATAGTHAITASGGAAANYAITHVGGTLTVDQAQLTVTADDQSKVYGAAEPELTYTPSGTLYYGETYDVISGVTLSAPTGAAATAGTHTITASGGMATNYQVTTIDGTFTVDPGALTVTAGDQTKVYGECDPTLTWQLTSGSLAYGDVLSGELTRAPGEDVSTYVITQGTLTAGANYNLTYAGADLTITQRPITVAADARTKVYGEADPPLTYQVTSGSLAFADAFTGTLSRTAGEDVGAYAIGRGDLALSANYTLTYVSADVTITQRPITVSADDQTKICGEVDPQLTYQITSGSLVSGDAFTGDLIREPGEEVGTYAITQGTLTAGDNYDLTFIGAELEIIAGTGAWVVNGVLKVVGTSGDDDVVIGKLPFTNQMIVIANFLPGCWHSAKFNADEIDRIDVQLGAGNDVAVVACNVYLPALLDGGSGNDYLKGGSGHDILLGQQGNDLLVGGGGRDLLIGGDGCDRIVGNHDDDILISGRTAFDSHAVALLAIMEEWTREDRDYAARIDNLKGNGTDGLNQDYFLKVEGDDQTVYDDDARDILTGGWGFDWFLANCQHDDEGKRDWITDRSAAELADDLDWIEEEVYVEDPEAE